MPNVGPYIYDVSISGFTRSSIYIYDISSLRVKSQWLYTFTPPIRQHGVVLDTFTFQLDNSLVCFLFTFEGQYRSGGLLFKCQTLGQSVTSQWTLIRKTHHSGLEVDQQETMLGIHVALDTTRAARVLKRFRKTYRPKISILRDSKQRTLTLPKSTNILQPSAIFQQLQLQGHWLDT